MKSQVRLNNSCRSWARVDTALDKAGETTLGGWVAGVGWVEHGKPSSAKMVASEQIAPTTQEK